MRGVPQSPLALEPLVFAPMHLTSLSSLGACTLGGPLKDWADARIMLTLLYDDVAFWYCTCPGRVRLLGIGAPGSQVLMSTVFALQRTWLNRPKLRHVVIAHAPSADAPSQSQLAPDVSLLEATLDYVCASAATGEILTLDENTRVVVGTLVGAIHVCGDNGIEVPIVQQGTKSFELTDLVDPFVGRTTYLSLVPLDKAFDAR